MKHIILTDTLQFSAGSSTHGETDMNTISLGRSLGILFQKVVICFLLISCFVGSSVFADDAPLKLKLIRLVDNKTLRPGSGDFFTLFEPPYLFKDTAVFVGYGRSGRSGIYTNLHGEIQPMTNTETRLVPKGPTFGSFSDNYLGTDVMPALYKSKVIFFGNGYGNGLTGVYCLDGKKIYPIVTEKSPVPGGAKGLFATFSHPGFFDGDAVFIGKGKDNVIGIYQGDKDGKLQILVDTDTPVPDQAGHFQNFLQLGFSRQENEAKFPFLALDAKKQLSIYFYNKGKLQKVVDQNTEIPKGVGFFKSIDMLSYDDQTGQVVFLGRGVLGQVGIYVYSVKKDSLVRVVDQDIVMPDDTDTFNDILKMSTDDGVIVFLATGHKGQKGIYLYKKGGVFKVLTNVDRVADQEVADMDMNKGALSQSYLGLSLKFRDGSKALYLMEWSA